MVLVRWPRECAFALRSLVGRSEGAHLLHSTSATSPSVYAGIRDATLPVFVPQERRP